MFISTRGKELFVGRDGTRRVSRVGAGRTSDGIEVFAFGYVGVLSSIGGTDGDEEVGWDGARDKRAP